MRLHQQEEQVTGHHKSSDKQGTGPNVETQNTVVGCYVREHASSGGQRTQVLERSSAAVGLALMIESIMFFSGGFLVASLLGLALISVVHQRAVRLTERQLADLIPMSMAEILADKDHLRAEFAMSTRRLEMSVEQLKAKATSQLADIVRKTEAINRLKSELAEKTAGTDEVRRALAAKEAELAKAGNDINEQRLASDTQRIEIAVLKTQVEQLKSQVADLEGWVAERDELLRERDATITPLMAETLRRRLT
jgi:peptidoglycan hydrolase CwlO-like protein